MEGRSDLYGWLDKSQGLAAHKGLYYAISGKHFHGSGHLVIQTACSAFPQNRAKSNLNYIRIGISSCIRIKEPRISAGILVIIISPNILFTVEGVQERTDRLYWSAAVAKIIALVDTETGSCDGRHTRPGWITAASDTKTLVSLALMAEILADPLSMLIGINGGSPKFSGGAWCTM